MVMGRYRLILYARRPTRLPVHELTREIQPGVERKPSVEAIEGWINGAGGDVKDHRAPRVTVYCGQPPYPPSYTSPPSPAELPRQMQGTLVATGLMARMAMALALQPIRTEVVVTAVSRRGPTFPRIRCPYFYYLPYLPHQLSRC